MTTEKPTSKSPRDISLGYLTFSPDEVEDRY